MKLTRESVTAALDAYHDARVTFDADAHRYFRVEDGKRIPGVTTVVGIIEKPALRHWYARIAVEHNDVAAPGREAAKGATVGKIAHDAIEAWAGGDPWETYMPDDPEARKATEAAVSWLDEVGAEVLATEVVTCDVDVTFGGTFDALAVVDGQLVLVDWKTNRSGLYAEHLLQSAAYAANVTSALGVRVDATVVVHCDRVTGRASSVTRTRDEHRNDLQLFRAALSLYKGLPPLKRIASKPVEHGVEVAS